MASADFIGNVTGYNVKTVDQMGNEYTTNISKSLGVNPEATYGQIDTASRAIVGLTTNTYRDTILVTEISVNEEVAEDD